MPSQPTAPARPRPERVLLKLSGEVFGGGRVGVDPDVVAGIAAQLADVVADGTQVAVVVGGGNFFRGAELSQHGMDRARADYMGMLGTVMNCLALQDFLEKQGVATRVQTAIAMGQVAEPYVPRRASRPLEKGRVVLLGAGPRTDPSAKLVECLSYDEVLQRQLTVADASAFSLCRDNRLPIVVFNLSVHGNIARVVRGEPVGTLVAENVPTLFADER